MQARRTTVVLLVTVVSVLGFGLGTLPSPSESSPAGAPHVSTSLVAFPAVSSTASTGAEARQALLERIHSVIQADHVPAKYVLPPNLLGSGKLSDGAVTPLSTVAPAPMGLGDFGVANTTGTPAPYVLQSTSWEGALTLNSVKTFLIDNDGPDTFSVQLNTVTSNTTVHANSNNSFWTQNVVFYTPHTSTLQFVDNIWNFSSPAFAENTSTFYSYNGTVLAPVYYYDIGPSFTVPLPFTIHLFLNTSTTDMAGTGYSTVRFGYDILNRTGASVHHGVYDTVLFNSTLASASVPLTQFMVNGYRLTPTNALLYDSELMIGGPGGGTTTSVYGINGTETLQYYNSTLGRYANDPTAWNVGTDTGESSEGISEAYSAPGTVELSPGPSIPVPLWNATPGGHIGIAHVTGTIVPANGFLFVNGGSLYNSQVSAWTPISPTGAINFTAPPGTYSWRAMMSRWNPNTSPAIVWVNGSDAASVALTPNPALGIYTPLFAWNNAELANISSGGNGTPSNPYTIFNNSSPSGLNSEFGEANDFLYPVFPGILLANTRASAVIDHLPALGIIYNAAYFPLLDYFGLPLTNDLQIEVYGASNVVLENSAPISGWFFGFDYGPELGFPLANAVFWDASNSVVSGDTFVSQGSSLLFMNDTTPSGRNGIWGNNFINGSTAPAMLNSANPSGWPGPVAIWDFESGDLFYSNYIHTSYTAYALDTNLFDGLPQVNLDNWNLTAGTPASPAGPRLPTNDPMPEGQPSAGTCGNFWVDFAAGDPLPWKGFYGSIQEGGDYCASAITPLTHGVTFTESGLSSGTWSVTIAGQTLTNVTGNPISTDLLTGTWNYTVGAVAGYAASPAAGTVEMSNFGQSVAVTFVPTVGPGTVVFVETGLPSGTAWSVTVGGTAVSSTGGSASLSEAAGAYAYTVGPVPGFTAFPSSGNVNVISGGETTVAVAFTGTRGWIAGTVSPAIATVTVDGAAVATSSGVFNVSAAAGLHAIKATASGYLPYVNNVTVAGGVTTHVPIVLPSSGPSSVNPSGGGLSPTDLDAIVGAIVVLAIAIVIGAALMRARRGGPPPASGWNAPPSRPPSSGA
jgi:thermopsin